jgi:hypothetical protein
MAESSNIAGRKVLREGNLRLLLTVSSIFPYDPLFLMFRVPGMRVAQELTGLRFVPMIMFIVRAKPVQFLRERV